MSLFILWEDKAIGPITGFGPHVFLIACVAPRLHVDRYELMRSGRIDGKPCAGNANVFRELQRGPLWDTVTHVVAVLDTDELHDRLPGIPSRRTIADTAYTQWSDSVVSAVRKHAPEVRQSRLEICFLDHNLEALLSLIGDGMPELSRALGKRRLDRDKILQRAAGDENSVRRACAEMPSWEHLVATVTRLLAGVAPVTSSGPL
jgi:hypothetical protein